MMDEFAATDRALTSVTPADAGARAAANASIFRERGLSSDTSILADYGVATALQAIRDQGLLRAGAVGRVGIVGPGLDFTNKADGYDFYPQQTIQPFALIDTLQRIGLAAPGLQLTTFDVSSRVNEHIKTASERATSASGYVLTLPLDGDEAWTTDLLTYWKTLGGTIGEEIAAARVPVAAGNVLVRSVRVRPEIVRSIAPRDLNIVLARLPLADRRSIRCDRRDERPGVLRRLRTGAGDVEHRVDVTTGRRVPDQQRGLSHAADEAERRVSEGGAHGEPVRRAVLVPAGIVLGSWSLVLGPKRT